MVGPVRGLAANGGQWSTADSRSKRSPFLPETDHSLRPARMVADHAKAIAVFHFRAISVFIENGL